MYVDVAPTNANLAPFTIDFTRVIRAAETTMGGMRSIGLDGLDERIE